MRALVVGYGSIGTRHADILKKLGYDVAVVSARRIDLFPCWSSISTALVEENPDYIVLASPTAQHYDQFVELASLGFQGKLLVEKPLFNAPQILPTHGFASIWVAYNLRFHPLLQKLHLLLKQEKILSVQAYVGQYLPQWRPERDYRSSYSAKRSEGGGVLRDLSHELDYLTWLLGSWIRVVAIGGHYSSLEIDSDDIFSIMMATEKCPVVMLQMNYLDKISQRQMTINTETRTYCLDLLNGILKINDNSEAVAVGRNDTYQAMHTDITTNQIHQACSIEEGLDVVGLIAAIEHSAKSKEWVVR